MAKRTHVILPDPHAKPGVSNRRAEWAGKFINDIRPDTVVSLGDVCDFESLCSYDKGRKSFQGRTYKADIDAHSDFQDRLWSVVRKAKKRLPRRITLIGNHEQRITRAMMTWNWITSMTTWFLTKALHPALLTWMGLLTLTISFLELVDGQSRGNIWHTVYCLSTMLVSWWAIITPSITVFAPSSTADEFRQSVREYFKSTKQRLLAKLRSSGGQG
jgi:hypothetical protein